MTRRTTATKDANNANNIFIDIGLKKENISFSFKVGFLAKNTKPVSLIGILNSIFSSLSGVIVKSIEARSILFW